MNSNTHSYLDVRSPGGSVAARTGLRPRYRVDRPRVDRRVDRPRYRVDLTGEARAAHTLHHAHLLPRGAARLGHILGKIARRLGFEHIGRLDRMAPLYFDMSNQRGKSPRRDRLH